MKVKAIQMGTYANKMREVGEVFDIKDEHAFSHKWMVKVSNDGKPLAEPKNTPVIPNPVIPTPVQHETPHVTPVTPLVPQARPPYSGQKTSHR